MRPKPFLLLILDGWGYSEVLEANAIAAAATPVWDDLWSNYPHTLINTSGAAVGLPDGQMGNSEVGHMNLGAGRVVPQDFTRIGAAFASGGLAQNAAVCGAIDSAVANGKALHLMGLLSPGGVHSHIDHIAGLLSFAAARGAKRIFLHGFLDGRDTPPRSAAESLRSIEATMASLGVGRIASLVGRYYAMDRDQRWDRVELAYRLLIDGRADFHSTSAQDALAQAYARDENDEFVKPTIIGDATPIVAGDSVLFANFRADRARQLTRALTEPEFADFDRGAVPAIDRFVALTEYYSEMAKNVSVAFPPTDIAESLGEVVANAGRKQLRIAETEKYAHVTFFFNGGQEQEFIGEDRVLIPSPKVATYDLQPEMSAAQLTEKLVSAIRSQAYDLIVCNYANPDMVGHTGKLAAAQIAAEVVDGCLGEITAALTAVGGEMLVTADHGNLEQMSDPHTGQPHTAHTTNPVPLVYYGREMTLRDGGALSDIAPTILAFMGLTQPAAMTGKSLVALAPVGPGSDAF